MWNVEVKQQRPSVNGKFTIDETMNFKVDNLSKADEIIQVFEKYSVGKSSYSIIQKQEGKIDE